MQYLYFHLPDAQPEDIELLITWAGARQVWRHREQWYLELPKQHYKELLTLLAMLPLRITEVKT